MISLNRFPGSLPIYLGLLGVFVAGLIAVDLSAQEQETAVAPPSLVVGDPAGTPLSGDALEAETDRVASLVRCPVCQGLSVNDSPAPMAVNMKRQVRDLLAEGYTEKQILSYFERSYGEFVLLEPPLRGINWLVWLAPGILLLVGIAIVIWFFRRGREPVEHSVEAAEIEEENAETDPYILEVRRLAYGESEEAGK